MPLQTDLNNIASDLGVRFAAAPTNLATEFAAWNIAFPALFNEELVTERTVRNWFVPSRTIELDLSSPPNTSDLQNVIAVVVRTIEAGIAAESAGRISAAQATAMSAAYNTAFPV